MVWEVVRHETRISGAPVCSGCVSASTAPHLAGGDRLRGRRRSRPRSCSNRGSRKRACRRRVHAWQPPRPVAATPRRSGSQGGCRGGRRRQPPAAAGSHLAAAAATLAATPAAAAATPAATRGSPGSRVAGSGQPPRQPESARWQPGGWRVAARWLAGGSRVAGGWQPPGYPGSRVTTLGQVTTYRAPVPTPQIPSLFKLRIFANMNPLQDAARRPRRLGRTRRSWR